MHHPPAIFIGTSGCSYEHWQGCCYPDDLPSDEMPAFYAQLFTHMKKLKDPAASLPPFQERFELLDRNLGPILFQSGLPVAYTMDWLPSLLEVTADFVIRLHGPCCG